jgi:hypothetical protein
MIIWRDAEMQGLGANSICVIGRRPEMVLKTLLGSLFLFLVGCAAVNPFNVPEGDVAYLKNREEIRGNTILRYYFSSAMIANGEQKRLSSFWRGTDEIFEIPSGEVYLGLKIHYQYKRGIKSFGEALSTSFTYLYSSESRAKVDAAADAARAVVDILAEVKVNALKGQTYQIKSNIENGKVLIWIEDDKGIKVSEVVRGRSRFGENVPDPY